MAFKDIVRKTVLPIKQESERKIHKLKYMFFELTQRCNLSCIHCGSDCKKDARQPDLPAEKVLEVLREIKKNQNPHDVMIILSGGEVTIYPELWELGKKIIELEFPWGIVTNGLAWTKDTIKKAKESHMHSISVSLDGLEESHNWLRNSVRSYRKALNTIQMLVDNPFYRKMDVITCVNKRNIDELDKMFEIFKKMGLKRWRLTTIEPIGRAKNVPELFLDKKQFHHLMNKIMEFNSGSDMHVLFSDTSFLGCYEHKVRNYYFFCGAGVSVGGIMVNGDIMACPNIDRGFKQGNVFEDSFMDVWENKYEIFRKRDWMKKGICANCADWKMCKGGPFHLWNPDGKEINKCYLKEYDLGKCLK